MLAGICHALSNRSMRVITAIFILLTFGGVACADTIRIYHVGNSLTWDSNVALTSSSLRNQGHIVAQGYHIACGKSLVGIVHDPDVVCVPPPEPYGTWTNALANYEWDKVTIQAWAGATPGEELTATTKILDLATAQGRNRSCIFYLLLAWPLRDDSVSFSDLISSPFAGENAPTLLSSGFLEYWYEKITARYPDLDVRVIPTGIALMSIDQKLKEISIGPYTNTYALYRDRYHMTSEGQHLAAMTMLSTLSGIRPEAHTFPSGYSGFLSGVNSNLVALIHDVIWYNISAEPRTKVAVAPNVTLGFNHLGNIYECSFVGTLFHSTNSVDWTEIEGATSPYRFAPVQPTEFFRSRR